jgi:acyl-CoA hydrolase
VRVQSENPLTGEHRHTASAYLTFVALDEAGQPTPVPPLGPESDDEKRRFEDGRRRHDDRVARRIAERERDRAGRGSR